MSQHFIYHIIGKKVGCTTNPQRRLAEQGVQPEDYVILQVATSAKDASILEREWQERLGYKVDNIPYHKALHMSSIKRFNKKLRDKKMGLL